VSHTAETLMVLTVRSCFGPKNGLSESTNYDPAYGCDLGGQDAGRHVSPRSIALLQGARSSWSGDRNRVCCLDGRGGSNHRLSLVRPDVTDVTPAGWVNFGLPRPLTSSLLCVARLAAIVAGYAGCDFCDA
jgi:hypothetical protein